MSEPIINAYSLLMILTFVLGYFFITIEHITKINKTSIALLMAIICWILQFANEAKFHEENLDFLAEHSPVLAKSFFSFWEH